MNADKRRQIFERLAIAIPEPVTELEYSSPFELLIAVVLSAQATDKGVNKATRQLFPVANTPEGLLALGRAASRPTSTRLVFSTARPVISWGFAKT
jgi:endonuclease-3